MILGVWAAPAAPKKHHKGWGVSHLTVGMVLPAVKAAHSAGATRVTKRVFW